MAPYEGLSSVHVESRENKSLFLVFSLLPPSLRPPFLPSHLHPSLGQTFARCPGCTSERRSLPSVSSPVGDPDGDTTRVLSVHRMELREEVDFGEWRKKHSSEAEHFRVRGKGNHSGKRIEVSTDTDSTKQPEVLVQFVRSVFKTQGETLGEKEVQPGLGHERPAKKILSSGSSSDCQGQFFK